MAHMVKGRTRPAKPFFSMRRALGVLETVQRHLKILEGGLYRVRGLGFWV